MPPISSVAAAAAAAAGQVINAHLPPHLRRRSDIRSAVGAGAASRQPDELLSSKRTRRAPVTS